MTMVLEPLKKVFRDAWRWWGDDQVPRLSAALTFYAMLSLAPMLVLAVTTAGFMYGEESARANITEQIKSALGEAQAAFVKSLLQPHSEQAGIWAAVFSIAVLLFGASGLAEQLRDSVNAIWGLKAPQGGFLTIVKRKVFAILGVVLAAVVLLGWMILDAWLQWLSKNTVESAAPLWQAVSLIVSVVLLSLVFGAMFKALPRKRVAWNDVWFAAVFTSLAFTAGRYLLSLYFAFASVSAGYGAAGAMVVILLWFFYSSQIFFFGVELSNAYAFNLGSFKGQPHDNETKVTATGQVTKCPEGEPSVKTDQPVEASERTKETESQRNEEPDVVYLHDPDVPAPSLTSSLAGLGQSLGHLGKTFADLGKSLTGHKRDEKSKAA
jgi:membrane protein